MIIADKMAVEALIKLFPAVAIGWVEGPCQEENDIHHPPHPDPTKSQQLADAMTCVSKAKPVDSQDTQKERIQENSWEVMALVPAGGKVL